MKKDQSIASYSPATIRERIEHLAVDLEYASRSGDSVYSEHINNKIKKLYNLLERIQNVRKG